MDGCYICSDGRLMCYEDLICWLIFETNHNRERQYWSFDDFTGGTENFLEQEFYLKAKEWFERFKRSTILN